jgi:hypothetical protein
MWQSQTIFKIYFYFVEKSIPGLGLKRNQANDFHYKKFIQRAKKSSTAAK